MDWLCRDPQPVHEDTQTCLKFAQCWVFSGVLTSCTASLSMYIYISLTPTDRYTHTVFDYNWYVLFPPAVMRCLGLPARSISNFNSAHDTQFNRVIDRFFSEDGEMINKGDSVWCTPSHTYIQYNTVHVEIVDKSTSTKR